MKISCAESSLANIINMLVDKSLTVEVSHRIKEDFGNGKEYYAHHGSKLIILPKRYEQMPDPHYLEWHNQNVYLG